MTLPMKPLSLALLFVLSQGTVLAQVQTPSQNVPRAAAAARPAAAPAPARRDAVDQWLVVQDTTYVPVIDDVTRKLAAARDAYKQHDTKAAAAQVREAAALLAAQAAPADREAVGAARTELNKLASGLLAGHVKSLEAFDAAYAKALRSDAVMRTAISDETIALVRTDEPDRHFAAALKALAAKDYQRAAVEIRKGEALINLVAARAGKTTHAALQASAAELQKLATAVARGTAHDAKTLEAAFARADHALALSHHARAAQAWTSKETRQAGGELKAAAGYAAHAADRTGGGLAAAMSAAVTDARAVGDKLEAGAAWTRAEVDKAFAEVADAINAVGKRIHSGHKASPFDGGA